ncbi:MAG: hypothetical protein EOO77_17435 [Oxalobacteraceae bacterium]|nr:MAG: hypothetical protein EOO77_17435 [Oxalobacteraceae bacterium]
MDEPRPNLFIAGIVPVVGQRVGYSDRFFESGRSSRSRTVLGRRGVITKVAFWHEETIWLPMSSVYEPGMTGLAHIAWEDDIPHMDAEMNISMLWDGTQDEPAQVFVPTHPTRPRTEAADLPRCKLHVGMQIRPQPMSGYQRRKILRATIRETLKVVTGLRRKGYCTAEPGDTTALMRNHKKHIRDFMYVIDNAYEIEVVGIHAVGHHVGRHVTNQCYIGITSGLAYYGQLLWRAVNPDGNHVCVMQSSDTLAYTFSERELLEREIKMVGNG